MAKITTKTAQPESKPEAAKFWMNVGIENENGNLINIPRGIPLYETKGVTPSERLVNELLALADQLEPGEARQLNMVVSIRKVAEPGATPRQAFKLEFV